ncbi:CDK6 [Bugula neritina]|uniref:cyclin-dependent kinase n=1 Tax=Bugula neritina TaxID=10212 RepID=A0A7J7JHZ5_BUGNE|nr:CDK6 [Bugula neritina]
MSLLSPPSSQKLRLPKVALPKKPLQTQQTQQSSPLVTPTSTSPPHSTPPTHNQIPPQTPPQQPYGSCDGEDVGNVGNYESLNLVGTGAYGSVYRARDLRESDRFVALKKIRMKLSDEGVPLNALREIGVLRRMDKFDHPNIVKLLDICVGDYCPSIQETTLTFVFEYMDMDLSQYIHRCPPPGLPLDIVKKYMYQMLQGVDFLHASKIIHRDLKPQNVLLSSNGHLKLADMGLARIYTFSMLLTSTVVTLWYRAPEVLMQDAYGAAVDLWSLGCMFVEMLTRRPLFNGQSEIMQLQKIFSIIGLPDEQDWPPRISLPRSSFPYSPQIQMEDMVPELTDPHGPQLLEMLLKFNQYERITASSALAHPYFADLHQDSANESPSNDTDVSAAPVS